MNRENEMGAFVALQQIKNYDKAVNYIEIVLLITIKTSNCKLIIFYKKITLS